MLGKLKEDNQNILDYLLTNYGNISSLFTFMADNSIQQLSDFDVLPTIQLIVTYQSNPVLSLYNMNNITVVTGIINQNGD